MGYALSSIGFVFDAMSLLAPSLAVVGAGVGSVEFFYVWARYARGASTEGDVVMAAVGVVPILGMYKPLKGLGVVGTAAEAVGAVDYAVDFASWVP